MGGEIREMKRQLRKAVKGAVAALTAEERQQQSKSVFGELKRVVEARGAQTILAFWSMPDEIDTHGWVESLWQSGYRILLPVVVGPDLVLREYTGGDCLSPVPPYGIEEPVDTPEVMPQEVELVVVPGVAFDAQMGRMGHGKGFYDRLFPSMPRAYRVGVCYSVQMVDMVPMEEHDYRMDCVLVGSPNTALPHGER